MPLFLVAGYSFRWFSRTYAFVCLVHDAVLVVSFLMDASILFCFVAFQSIPWLPVSYDRQVIHKMQDTSMALLRVYILTLRCSWLLSWISWNTVKIFLLNYSLITNDFESSPRNASVSDDVNCFSAKLQAYVFKSIRSTHWQSRFGIHRFHSWSLVRLS